MNTAIASWGLWMIMASTNTSTLQATTQTEAGCETVKRELALAHKGAGFTSLDRAEQRMVCIRSDYVRPYGTNAGSSYGK